MIIREFVTKLGFDADESKVRSFDNAVKGMAAGLAAAVAAMSAVSIAAFKLAGDAAKYGDEVAKTSRQIGIGSEALQEYRFAFDRLGVSEGEATSALERFSRALGRAAQGEKTEVEAFQRLGINIRDSAGELRRMEDLLPDVADAMAAAGSEAERTAMAQDIFGRSGGRLAAALAAGGAEISDLREEFRMLGGGLSDEQTLAAEGFTDALTNMRTVMQGLRLQIGARLMPVIQPMIEAFTMFMVQNREIIGAKVEQAFVVIGNVLSNLTGIVRGVIDVFGPIVRMFNEFGPAGWAAAAAILAFVLPFGRFHKILMLIAGLSVFEDIGAWMNGQVSVIGRLLPPYKEFASVIAEWVEWLNGLETIIIGLVALKFAPWLFGVARGITALATAMGILGGGAAAKGAGVLAGLAGISRAAMGGAILSLLPTAAADGTLTDEEFSSMVELDQPVDEYRGASGTPHWVSEAVRDLDEAHRRFNPADFEASSPADFLVSSPDDLMQHLDAIGSTNVINMDVTQNITVPPGTTAEQLAIIRREAEYTMSREIDRAVKALED